VRRTRLETAHLVERGHHTVRSALPTSVPVTPTCLGRFSKQACRALGQRLRSHLEAAEQRWD